MRDIKFPHANMYVGQNKFLDLYAPSAQRGITISNIADASFTTELIDGINIHVEVVHDSIHSIAERITYFRASDGFCILSTTMEFLKIGHDTIFNNKDAKFERYLSYYNEYKKSVYNLFHI